MKLKTKWISSRVPSTVICFVFHGQGDSLQSFLMIQKELKLPQVNFCILQAPLKYYDGFQWYGKNPQLEVPNLRQQILSIITGYMDQGYRSENMFFLGHSQGAFVALDFVTHIPMKFAGAISISGYFYPSFLKTIKTPITPIFATHGKSDDVIPVQHSSQQLAQLRKLGISLSFQLINKGHEVDEVQELPMIQKWMLKTLAIQQKDLFDLSMERVNLNRSLPFNLRMNY